MSKTMVVAPIMGAIVGTEEILGKNRKWNAVNDTQREFLNKYFATRAELSGYSKEELRHWVSWVAEELNKILKEEGFDIQLQDFEPNEFGVVSILDVLVEWLVKGTEDHLVFKGTEYPAVRMENTAEVDNEYKVLFESLTSTQHPLCPIALVHTQSGDKVYMTVADRAAEGFDLTNRINEIRTTLQRGEHYDYLKFPMVDLNQQVDIAWLMGMNTTDENTGNPAIISQALQQTKFKMNQFGARVKSAVAIGVVITSVPPPPRGLEIDRPFFLWIEREGITVPVMYAYLDQEDWKDPGNLSEM